MEATQKAFVKETGKELRKKLGWKRAGKELGRTEEGSYGRNWVRIYGRNRGKNWE